MRKGIAASFVVAAIGYVAAMTLTSQVVEWIAVAALLACAAVPLLTTWIHRPGRFNPIVEGKLKEDVKKVGLAMATGHILLPVPPPPKTSREQLKTGATEMAAGVILMVVGDRLQIHGRPAGTVLGVIVLCISVGRFVTLLFGWATRALK